MRKTVDRLRVKWAVPSLVVGFLSQVALAWEPLPATPPIPANNPMSAAKIELGKQLYFDKRLSKTQEVSCNHCHRVDQLSGTDSAQFSTGIKGQKGDRNSPTVWNSAYLSALFWDGRAASLEDQAKGPLINPKEMGMKDHAEVMKVVSSIPAYVKQFNAVFGPKDAMTIDHLAQAIAAYERTLVTPNSPFDQFIRGNKKAMSAQAQRGMKLVETVGCLMCHNGVMFAGPTLPPGQGFYMKFPLIAGSEYDKKYGFSKDLGRFNVTHKEEDKNLWRVASWRNVGITGPYFHNGSVATLDEAVRVMAKTQLGKELKPAEVSDIVAFLNSLTGSIPKQTPPATAQPSSKL